MVANPRSAVQQMRRLVFVIMFLFTSLLTWGQDQGCLTCPSPDCSTLTECDFGGIPKDPCQYDGGCPPNYLPGVECCCWNSPILVDVDGSGFHLTGPEQGVLFDIVGKGVKSRVAWPVVGSTNSWLVLDRNGNGVVDDITELFGNRTEQPPPRTGSKRNGFLALAVFDTIFNGGNEDGVIDSQDQIYSRLRLLQDLNHNGISEASELKPLRDLGIEALDLGFKESRKIDPNGNQFVFRAKVYDSQLSHASRWCWDVALRTLPPPGYVGIQGLTSMGRLAGKQ